MKGSPPDARKLFVGVMIATFSASLMCGATVISNETVVSNPQIRRRIVAKPTVLRFDPPLFSAETKPDVDMRQDIKALAILYERFVSVFEALRGAVGALARCNIR